MRSGDTGQNDSYKHSHHCHLWHQVYFSLGVLDWTGLMTWNTDSSGSPLSSITVCPPSKFLILHHVSSWSPKDIKTCLKHTFCPAPFWAEASGVFLGQYQTSCEPRTGPRHGLSGGSYQMGPLIPSIPRFHYNSRPLKNGDILIS